MVPDRLPAALREVITRFPKGSLQFEIGIQTFDRDTSARISRRQDLVKLEDNLRFLAEKTEVHVHADLIAGLPGESWQSFAAGFDRLYRMAPHEIQVGILKRLRGAPIARHTEAFEMVYSQSAPYEVLQTSELSFADLARLKRFARAWDLVANRGNFRETCPLLCQGPSAFASFMEFTDWLYQRVGAFKGIALKRLCELALEFLAEQRGVAREIAGPLVAADYGRSGRRMPGFLLEYVDRAGAGQTPVPAAISSATPKRQARHLD
jgi:hypothetical protein